MPKVVALVTLPKGEELTENDAINSCIGLGLTAQQCYLQEGSKIIIFKCELTAFRECLEKLNSLSQVHTNQRVGILKMDV